MKEKQKDIENTLVNKLNLGLHIAISVHGLQGLNEQLGVVVKQEQITKMLKCLQKYYEKDYVTY